ncbi:hypothetical protein [Nonomuraea dietziae]|uniref:hypothetical protein n=1 Tax=Nonomuraea dietziae TaxID=65515 RepID=UPI0031D325A1
MANWLLIPSAAPLRHSIVWTVMPLSCDRERGKAAGGHHCGYFVWAGGTALGIFMTGFFPCADVRLAGAALAFCRWRPSLQRAAGGLHHGLRARDWGAFVTVITGGEFAFIIRRGSILFVVAGACSRAVSMAVMAAMDTAAWFQLLRGRHRHAAARPPCPTARGLSDSFLISGWPTSVVYTCFSIPDSCRLDILTQDGSAD